MYCNHMKNNEITQAILSNKYAIVKSSETFSIKLIFQTQIMLFCKMLLLAILLFLFYTEFENVQSSTLY